jgi:hypothetical protein
MTSVRASAYTMTVLATPLKCTFQPAFVTNLNYAGGLDFIYLCYDTCAHKPGGRRYEEGTMPWHDCHCAVTGPAAWDVLEGALPYHTLLHQ